MVLMLAGLVGLYGIVQAQSTGSRTVITTVGGITVPEHDRSFERVYGSAGITAATDTIVTVGIGTTAPATPTTPAVVGLVVEGDGTTNDISGYQVDSSLFQIDGAGVVSARNAMMPDPDTAGQFIPNPEGTARNLTTINNPDGPNTFTFTVNVFVDTDTSVDSNLAIAPPDGIDPEVAARNARNGFVQAATVTADDFDNDLDEVNTLTVTVRILKAKALTAFAAIPASASANDLLYGTEGQSRGVQVTGLASGMTIRDIVEADGEVADTVDGSTAIYGVADAQNVVWLKYVETYNTAEDGTNGDLLDASGNIPTEGAASVQFTASVDTNPSNADKDGTRTTDLIVDGVTITAQNNVADDVSVIFVANITLYDVLEFAPAGIAATDPDGSADKPYSYSIRSNAEMGRQAGVIVLMGAADAEDVDVIVRGGGPFTAVPRKVVDAYDQVVVQASRQLTPADEGMHDIVVTINGRALPTRTAEAYVRIQVTASNAVPIVDAAVLTNGKLILSVSESDKTASETATTTTNGLITAMTTGTSPTNTLVAGGDLSVYVIDENTLTYSVDDATAFNFKAGTSLLTPSGDLAVTGVKAATGKIDDPSTADIDESKTIYEAQSGGKFSNPESTEESWYLCRSVGEGRGKVAVRV